MLPPEHLPDADTKRMLARTSLSVSAFSRRIDLSDPANFIDFKREAGCTPVELRRSHEPR
ncbi:TPA: helix-turn-helix transcriptional regulator [Burkholderia vietnamiensis]|nr:helix-turn-helix transcriptional regulator [Burkholderia vietnamiensis]